MQKKMSVAVIIFLSVFMLNFSAMIYQQRYDRREEDENTDPFVIEMADLNVLKYLKNTWFFDLPVNSEKTTVAKNFFTAGDGFGHEFIITFRPFLNSQLKFLLIDYIGFYVDENQRPGTYFMALALG